jgi:hypothetical protein
LAAKASINFINFDVFNHISILRNLCGNTEKMASRKTVGKKEEKEIIDFKPLMDG